MSNKIIIPYYKISNTIYVTIRDVDGKVWNGTSFVTWIDGSIVSYVINTTYVEGSLYVVIFPGAVVNGYYTIQIFLQAGGSPVVANDIWIGNTAGYWDKDNLNLLGVRVDSLLEYSIGQRFTEKSLEEAPSGGGDGVTIIERTPKVQVKAAEGVETVTVPAEIEVLSPTVQRDSSGEITDSVERTSTTKVGP